MISALGFVLGLGQLLVTIALAWWGAWLGRLRGGPWRHLVWLPIAAFAASGAGAIVTVVGLVIAFQAIGSADPSQKATLLSDGISRAMAAGVGTMVLSVVLDVFSLIACAYGTLTAPRDPVQPDP